MSENALETVFKRKRTRTDDAMRQTFLVHFGGKLSECGGAKIPMATLNERGVPRKHTKVRLGLYRTPTRPRLQPDQVSDLTSRDISRQGLTS